MDAATHGKWLADTRRFWDAGSEFEAKYRRICASTEFAATDDEAELRRLWEQETKEIVPVILKDIPIQREWTCLEIGCGVGRLLKPIAGRCKRAVGVDISERMVDWAGRYLEGVPNAEVQLNDGASLAGVAGASVDFVYSHLAFQHITLVEVVDAYLREIARVLRDGGYCRIQNWREAPRPVGQALRDLVRPVLGREKYRSPRYWEWSEGREVKFGGTTFHARAWKKRLRGCGLRPISTELGVGHDSWMWTTSVREAR